MLRVALVWSLAAMAGLGATSTSAQDQAADLDFDTKVAAPAYTKRHPSVLFDVAHHNFHTTGGRYKPFVDLITNDGYRVEANRKPISQYMLGRHEILIIANAMGAEGGGPQAANPAMTEGECQAVDAWARAGGSLFLITDHLQFGAASRRLGRRFGVDMSQGMTVAPQNAVPRMPGRLVFSRDNDLLGDHPITQGRGPSERIGRVVTYSGQSLLGPRGSVPFLRLSETALDRYVGDPVLVEAAGRSQGVAFTHGKGRVVVLGEAGALSAQLDGAGRPFGMNDPGNDNRQLVLNIMHWLSGLIPVDPRAASDEPGRSSVLRPREGP